MEKLLKNINKQLSSSLSFLDNVYVRTAFIMFLVLYASMAAPVLPGDIAKLFDNTAFKVAVLALIIYIGLRDTTLALLIAIGLVLSIQTLNRYKVFSLTGVESFDTNKVRNSSRVLYEYEYQAEDDFPGSVYEEGLVEKYKDNYELINILYLI